MSQRQKPGSPLINQRKLTPVDAIALLVTLVIGVGVFRTPSLVASQVNSETILLGLWCAGGALSLAGALCYAELGCNYPGVRGEYGYLQAAYGDYLARLFGWSRLAVIQTGSIAMIAFIFADYVVTASGLAINPAWYAAGGILIITTINLTGIGPGTKTMNALALWKGIGIIALIIAGLFIELPTPPEAVKSNSMPGEISLGMVFVMLAYGGWSEASYLSRDMQEPGRNMMRVLVMSILLITGIYLFVNMAYIKSLGLTEFSTSISPAADLMTEVVGHHIARYFSAFVAICALGALNATIITGSRSTIAFFESTPHLASYGLKVQDERTAFLVQMFAAMLLVGIGGLSRDGFESMVAFTAPAFWIFFMLTTFSLIILRQKNPDRVRSFSVPLYPLTPLIFCGVCAFMTYASLRHAGIGSLIGLGIMILGIPLVSHSESRSS